MECSVKLSIIIPVYKTEQYLHRCLSSILGQDVDRGRYEVIIINDGSPDNSQAIIDEYCAKYDNVSCLVQTNQGQSVARNRGVELARGEYIWFVDSDDWVVSDSLVRVLSEVAYSPDVVMISRVGKKSLRASSFSGTIDGGKVLLARDFEQGPVFYILKQRFVEEKELRFVPGIYHEDSEIIPRFLYLAKKVRAISAPLYHVYENPTSTTRTINPKKSHDLLIVAERLSKFRDEQVVESEIKSVFDYLISVMLNNALANIVRSDKAEQQRFGKALYDHRSLFPALWRSSLKYRVEYVLFRLFPKHGVGIYRIMKRIQ